MEKQTPQTIINFILNDIFGLQNPMSLEEVYSRFTQNIPLPQTVKCAITGVDTWILPLETSPVVNQEAVRKQKGIEDWMKPTKPLNTIDEILAAWKEVHYQAGEKIYESVNVEKSDSVTASSNIFYSSLIGNSQNIVFGYSNFNSNYLLASRSNNSCSSGLRMLESAYCSSGFEVNFSKKVSKGFFINDCFDLYECMFCFGIYSKKYCIANMQYETQEYMRIKAIVVNWILESYGKENLTNSK
jgi:hypothetical protein